MKILLVSLLAAATASGVVRADDEAVTRIAFGSCNKHDLPQPLWKPILAWEPQVWIWLGDNVYGDSEDPAALEAKWNAQKSQPDYAKLRAQARILGTWDDHDYGINNGGRDFPQREASQKLLLDFLDEPAHSPRRRQAGVHATAALGPEGRQVCVILLDVRYHRDPPRADGDILGEAQWKWLEQTLADNRAQVHVICSGTQILPVEQRFEKWTDYPRSRQRLLDLLASKKTPGVVLLSGDRHFGELSRWEADGYEVTEATSSGLTHYYRNFPGEPNRLRLGEPFAALHFGTLEIDWSARRMTLALRGEDGRIVRSTECAF